jgi:hypothetical protein
MNETIRDLIELPLVRTVIQLADVDDEALSKSIALDFVLTADSDFALTAVLQAMAAGEGQGFFLQGNFGSGKSHLLALLRLLFREDSAWEGLVRQNRGYQALRQKLSPERSATAAAAVSLVEHAGSSLLEDIVLPAISASLEGPLGIGPSFAADEEAVAEIRAAVEARHAPELRRFLEERGASEERVFDSKKPDLLDDFVRALSLPFRVRRQRGAFFDSLEKRLGQKDAPLRLLLILDELSEFLRSKPDARAFHEDVRFLQFLGEASRRMPFYVVASLQEQIETTGEIDQTTFGKIKDRYPSRLSLTGTHLRELASGRLIKKKPGAGSSIAAIYRRLRAAFPALAVSEEEFEALYPVHPATIDLLDDLLPLFSRHRGAVDFLHYQLAGDPKRGIPGLLGEPPERLLGPDAILDHFRVRIQETLETSAYVSVVLSFYEKEAKRLFPEPEDRETALRLVKILVLLSISPRSRRRKLSELAEMLLRSVTSLDSSANYDYVHDLLEKMRLEGAYLTLEKGANDRDDLYSLDLTADVQLIIQRRVGSLLDDPGFGFARAVSKLLPGYRSPLLPLASLASSPRTERRAAWQKTRREGMLLFFRDSDDPVVSDRALEEIEEKLLTTELDFCLLLMGPRVDPSPPERLLAKLGESFLLWLPEPLGTGKNEPGEAIRRAAARMTVRDHYASEGSEVALRVVEALEPLIQEDLQLTEAAVQRAYRAGALVTPGSSPSLMALTPAELPSLPFDRLVDRLAEVPLGRRFPQHYQVAPSLDLPGADGSDFLLRDFLRAGEMDSRQISESLRLALDARLRPLGLVRRTASGYRLQPDPGESLLVRSVLERVGLDRVPLDTLYRELRKGSFGLLRGSFDLLVLALLYSGQLTAFQSGRRVSVETLDARSVGRIQELGPGEMLSSDLQSVLSRLPFVPPRLRQGAFGFAQQRELWELACQWKSEMERRLDGLKHEVERARSYRSAAHLDLDAIESCLDRLRPVVAAVKTSYAAREGLERLAFAAREEPALPEDLEKSSELSRFFAEDWERFLFFQRYLSDPALETLGEHPELASERHRLQELARSPDLPFRPELVRALQEGMGSFIGSYGESYEREHRAQRSPERLEGLRRVRETKAYGLLRRLSELRHVSVDDDLGKVDRFLDEAQAKTCARFSPEVLRAKPACECGFRLGETLGLPSPSEVSSAIERGVLQYLERLREPPFREAIESAAHGLEQVGRGALVSRMRGLLALERESPDALRRAEELLSREVVDALNGALAGRAVLVERSFDELAERIVGKSFPRDKLARLVERWIDGERPLGPDDYVKVVAGALGRTAGAKLFSFVAERFPELSSWWRERGESRASRLTALAFSEGVVETLEPERTSLVASAFESFCRENPEEAAQVLEGVEAELTSEERGKLLPSEDDPLELLKEAYQERAFRFRQQERARRLLRAVLAGVASETSLRALEGLDLPERPEPMERRLGTRALARALRSAIALRRAVRASSDLEAPPESTSAWEALYRDHLAMAPSSIATVEEAVRELGIEDRLDVAPFVREALRVLDSLAAAFEPFYLARSSDWTAESAERPWMLPDLFGEIGAKYRKKLSPAAEWFVLLDGMRWDTWVRLRDGLLARLSASYRVIDEIALWSRHPTTTQVQLDGAGIRLPEVPLAAESPEPFGRLRPDPAFPGFHRLSGPNRETIDRLNLIDEKIHESTAALADLHHEIDLHARRTLAVALEEARPGTLVFLFSDHGFRENRRWSPADRHRRPRYGHGGASPWEVITPLAVLYRS